MLIVLSVFNHRMNGKAYVVTFLRATLRGFYSFFALLITLAVKLPRMGMLISFTLAVCVLLAAFAAFPFP